MFDILDYIIGNVSRLHNKMEFKLKILNYKVNLELFKFMGCIMGVQKEMSKK